MSIILVFYIISVNRIAEISRLEGASGGYLVEYPAQSKAIKFRLLEAFSTQVSKTSTEGDSATPFSMTVLKVKFFLILSVKLLVLSSQ